MDRSLIISLLEEEDGVSADIYNLLFDVCFDHNWSDITKEVKVIDGRYYLPENHTLTPSVAIELI